MCKVGPLYKPLSASVEDMVDDGSRTFDLKMSTSERIACFLDSTSDMAMILDGAPGHR